MKLDVLDVNLFYQYCEYSWFSSFISTFYFLVIFDKILRKLSDWLIFQYLGSHQEGIRNTGLIGLLIKLDVPVVKFAAGEVWGEGGRELLRRGPALGPDQQDNQYTRIISAGFHKQKN